MRGKGQTPAPHPLQSLRSQPVTPTKAYKQLNDRIVACERCPRLRRHCRQIAIQKRASFRDQAYYGRPVPHFGDPRARVLIVGLAPAAHGANRTGRMFTGDRSGDWLYRAMHQTGFANQANATCRGDGLQLSNALVTAAIHCAPPANKPTGQELARCACFLDQTFDLLEPLSVVIGLGRIAFEAVLKLYARRGWVTKRSDYRFAHGAQHEFPAAPPILCSYHPSQQNTFTGRLTESMLRGVFERARDIAATTSTTPSTTPAAPPGSPASGATSAGIRRPSSRR